VLTLAADLGVHAHYCRDSLRCEGATGLPDLILAGPGGVLWRELKAGGDLDDGQRAWRDTLRKSGADWAVWTPAAWITRQVHREMQAIASPR